MGLRQKPKTSYTIMGMTKTIRIVGGYMILYFLTPLCVRLKILHFHTLIPYIPIKFLESTHDHAVSL